MSEVDIRRGQIADAFLVPAVTIVIDELADAPFEIAGQGVVLKQHSVFHRLMPALDLAMGRRVIGRAARKCAIPRSPSQVARSLAT